MKPRLGLEKYPYPHTGGKKVSSLCNSCRTISPKLNSIIDKTYVTGKEMSVAWCVKELDTKHMAISLPVEPYESDRRSQIIKASDTEIGTETSVPSPHIQCEEGQIIANFHTHPTRAIKFSTTDYASSFLDGNGIACIGIKNSFDNNIIYCDIINTENEYYDEYKQEITHFDKTTCRPRAEAFMKMIETGKSFKTIEKARDLYKESSYEMMDIINGAIERGVINRCSLASNISK